MSPPSSSPSSSTFLPSPTSVTAVPNNDNSNKHNNMESTTAANPRTCILQIGVSTGRLCGVANSHLMSPTTTTTSTTNPNPNNTVLVWALKDVLSDLWIASQSLQLDLMVAIRSKMALNNKKYPVELCKGKAGKYTQYSAQTGVTKTNQSTIDQTTTNNNNSVGGGDTTAPGDSRSSSSPSSSQLLSLSEFLNQLPTLAADINDFATARSWAQFHTPRNLVLALMGEFGELAELLQWKGDDDDFEFVENDRSGRNIADLELLDKLSQELADVTIYLLRLATVCEVVEPLCEAMKEGMME